jgi:hypothetical protein
VHVLVPRACNPLWAPLSTNTRNNFQLRLASCCWGREVYCQSVEFTFIYKSNFNARQLLVVQHHYTQINEGRSLCVAFNFHVTEFVFVVKVGFFLSFILTLSLFAPGKSRLIIFMSTISSSNALHRCKFYIWSISNYC